MRAALFIVALCVLTGCGYIGPIQPPLLDIPQAVPYLSAIEYGDKIQVDFTLPELTTEGNPLRNVRSLEVRVGPGVTPFSTEAWAQTAKAYPVDSPAPGPFTKEIPAADWINKEVVISVRAIGPKGRPAQWATVKVLTVQPPLARARQSQSRERRAGREAHMARLGSEIPNLPCGRRRDAGEAQRVRPLRVR